MVYPIIQPDENLLPKTQKFIDEFKKNITNNSYNGFINKNEQIFSTNSINDFIFFNTTMQKNFEYKITSTKSTFQKYLTTTSSIFNKNNYKFMNVNKIISNKTINEQFVNNINYNN